MNQTERDIIATAQAVSVLLLGIGGILLGIRLATGGRRSLYPLSLIQLHSAQQAELTKNQEEFLKKLEAVVNRSEMDRSPISDDESSDATVGAIIAELRQLSSSFPSVFGEPPLPEPLDLLVTVDEQPQKQRKKAGSSFLQQNECLALREGTDRIVAPTEETKTKRVQRPAESSE